ncbi:hypothetical protein H0E87_010784 [Populus deltoides]|uniref:Uncharacterized protein n=1 Tax=Populus deltoides TaxID=3696 RepID=A0A8T2YUH6_POPDE|nr:hypothetical protein H0E87_010784 [Populus deltoides]
MDGSEGNDYDVLDAGDLISTLEFSVFMNNIASSFYSRNESFPLLHHPCERATKMGDLEMPIQHLTPHHFEGRVPKHQLSREVEKAARQLPAYITLHYITITNHHYQYNYKI